MIIDPCTPVILVDRRTGACTNSTINHWFNLLKLGSEKWDETHVVTEKAEADALRAKYKVLIALTDKLQHMSESDLKLVDDAVMRILRTADCNKLGADKSEKRQL